MNNNQKFIIAGIAFIGLLILILVDAYIVFPIQPPYSPTGGGTTNLEPNKEITIYAGRTPDGKFGFGLSPDNITSPGPTLKFKVGDIVKINFVNVGKIPHAFAIVQDVSENPVILFNSAIGSSTNPIPANGKASVVVKFDRAGEFKYMCTVPGHAQAGMWGVIEISG